jgi:FkbM family methyltransferase
MNNISNQIKKYLLKVDTKTIIINNYDYFTTEYNLPSDKLINIPQDYKGSLEMVKKINKNKTVIDIGGNCGLFCIPVEKEGYTVYSFEPIEMNVSLLEYNKKENNCNNLFIIPKAVSNQDVKRRIYIPYCSDNTSFNQEVAISNMKKKDFIEEEVDCIKFDTWIEKNKYLDVGFIKIDVQGFEKEVLEGMQNFLKSCNDVYILIEWDEVHTKNAGFSLNDLENLIYSNGFKLSQKYFGDKLFYKN